MTRLRLPNRRESTLFRFEHRHKKYEASFSRAPNGAPAEIFVDVDQGSTDRAALMRDAAVLISIALQYGADLETLRTALTREADGHTPASPIGAALDALTHEAAHG